MPILRPRRALAGLLLVVFAAALTACAGEGRQLAQAISDENHEAGSDENYAAPLAGETPGDPFEAANRAALERNLAVYDNVVGPAVEGYRASFPEVLRQGLSNVLDNLATPRIFINDLLQAEWERAAVSFARLAFNTTIVIMKS